ncbi:MAG: radical SAM/SPASM domain-containing protein [Candidatus Aminicenantales bacterium]
MKKERNHFKNPIQEIVISSLAYSLPRKLLMNRIQKKLYKEYLERDKEKFPRKVQEDKFYMARNMMYAMHRGLKRGQISKEVWTKFLNSFRNIYWKSDNKIKDFQEKYGFKPPAFVTISPTKNCNLQCIGCYANSFRSSRERLAFDIVTRVVREQKELWNSHFTVISGGEPLVYKSQGKTIFDLAWEHPDTFFLMYTNGTLINEEVAQKFAEAGNITPAISVEGFEEETDRRRGKGVHQKILRAFENLSKVGVPYGISITATRHNADFIMSDEFIDYYFNQHGVLYGWIFQYMPIGRSFTLDLMVTPQQRLEMYLKTWELIRERGIFMADFWNCGAVSSGCISAGKSGGYFYIDWNGNVMPCVFNPYKVDNIVEVYKRGGNLNTVLFSPFFKGIREWQQQYALNGPAHRMGNIIVPCAIRDHYEMMYDLIQKTKAQAADEASALALQDSDYYKGLVKYGKEVKKLTDVIWEKEYLEPERRRIMEDESKLNTNHGHFFKLEIGKLLRGLIH